MRVSPERSPRIFAGAGEVSGDRILSQLLQGLRSHFPDMEVKGFGGPLSEAQGLHSAIPIEELAVNGIGDIFKRGFFLLRSYLRFKRLLRNFKPDLVLLVDYPGMNIALARTALGLGFRVHYVAPPQLWAYRNPQRRLKRLQQSLRGASLQVLFPFEAELYESWATKLSQGHFFAPATVRPNSRTRLLLCPGSRRLLVYRNLPLWLKLLSGLKESKIEIDILTPEFLVKDVEQVVATVSTAFNDRKIEIITDPPQAFARARAAISFPGTMTLDLILQRIPTQVWAVIDPLTLRVGRKKLRHRFVALPNLLLDREVFPEWIGTKRDFNQNPPLFSAIQHSSVSDKDFAAIQDKIGMPQGVEIGVKACFELLI